MRVLQINKFFFEKGGTERYLVSLSRALANRGHTVIHFSMRHPDNLESPYARFFVSEKDYTKGTGSFEDITAGIAFIRSREAARSLSNLLAQIKPDVAHLHNIYHQITPSIIPVLRRAGVSVVMTLHDYKLVCPNYSLFDGKAYCYRCRGARFHRAALTRCHEGSFSKSLLLSIEAYWQRMTRVYDGISFFLAPSRYMRDVFLAEGYSADRVVYLPPFVASDFSSAESGAVESVVQTLPERYVLYFGRLGAEKGLFTLLDAASQLHAVPLVVCGEGPLRQALEDRARAGRARVQFTGHLEKPVLETVVRRSAAVVLPTTSPENAPFTVLEAMAAGIPVIVSSMGGLPELARSGGGVVFTAGNSRELADKIEEIWSNGSLAVEMGARGKRFVTEELTEDRHLAGLEAVYKRASGTN